MTIRAVVLAFKECLTQAAKDVPTDVLLMFTEPIIELLDFNQWLDQDDTLLRPMVESALVELFRATREDAQGTQLVKSLLQKTRSEHMHVRLATVGVLKALWDACSDRMVGTLSDFTLFAVELLEDSFEDVEKATRELFNTIANFTGEDVQALLKGAV